MADAPQDPPAATDPHEVLARAFVEHLSRAQEAQARATFDETMLGAMPEGALKGLWTQLQLGLGPFEEASGAKILAQGGYVIVLVRSRFEKGEVDIKVVYDKSQKVAGLFVVPVKAPEVWSAPDYADREAFTEREVSVGADPWVLPGTLTVPVGEGPHPAVVLVHGSGPNDRDETIGPNKPFKDLAWGLASRGIAVLRYDKRTLVHGQGMASIKNMSVKEESVDDAVEAVALLRRTEGIDPARISVIGHSLGATIIARITDRDDKLAGAVAMAPLGRTLEDTMVEQYTTIFSLDGQISDLEAQKLAEVSAERDKVKALTPSSEGSILGAPVSYWLDLKDFRPHEAAKGIGCPLLVLQGERDYQVTMVDFRMWEGALKGKAGVTLKSYPDLNHLFITGEGPSTPNEYEAPGHVDAVVISDLAEWLRAR